MTGWRPTLGAIYLGDGRCRFRVWAPETRQVQVRFRSPGLDDKPLNPEPGGYHSAVLSGVQPGVLYMYSLDGAEHPAPCSRHQPEGIGGPSAVVDPAAYPAATTWRGQALCRYVIYELHVGTFTPEGTFDAAMDKLDYLADLGVTAVELMPVAQFSGSRNWGCDGDFPFAVQNSYGGPHALRRFVDASAEPFVAVRPREEHGLGCDAVWNDDFHHALHALLTGERNGYYADFGRLAQHSKALMNGYVFTGEYARLRCQRQGSKSADIPGARFVVYAQNHDQVGNRRSGERLGALVSPEKLKLAAGLVLLAPFIPLLFMGEEFAETAPFLYFVSHSNPALVEAVRRGSQAEFEGFGWQGRAPDPQSVETFRRSKLDWAAAAEGDHAIMLEFARARLKLRATQPALARLDNEALHAAHVAGGAGCLVAAESFVLYAEEKES